MRWSARSLQSVGGNGSTNYMEARVSMFRDVNVLCLRSQKFVSLVLRLTTLRNCCYEHSHKALRLKPNFHPHDKRPFLLLKHVAPVTNLILISGGQNSGDQHGNFQTMLRGSIFVIVVEEKLSIRVF